jgi:hypothetical protein
MPGRITTNGSRTVWLATGSTVAARGRAVRGEQAIAGGRGIGCREVAPRSRQQWPTHDQMALSEGPGEDGRLLVADITDATIETTTIPATTVTQPQVSDCSATMKTHAFLSRAQFQCDYRYYSQAMINNARVCRTQFNESEAKDLLTSGMATFDRNEKERGHRALCSEILKTFPSIVRQ